MARILLIDDEETVRTMLRWTLTHYGHTVIEARDGREGLRLFPDANADLVITDLIMPETEGFEVLEALGKIDPPVKIIVMSGGVLNSVDNYLQMALRLGARKALSKPFSHVELMAAINEVLEIGPSPAA